MRLLFLGDVVGKPGRQAVVNHLPDLRARWALDCVIVNGENAAGGFGITESICAEILGAGADVVTLGNHSFDQREALVFIEREPRLLRPANLPQGTPGRGATVIQTAKGQLVMVINAMGRIYMDPLDCPFNAVERELAVCPLGSGCDAVIIDMHAEATSEKQAMGHFIDGRASLVVGTHTHVPTADERILKEEPIRRFLQKTPGARLEAAAGDGTLSGVAVETDDRTGLAIRVKALRIGPHLTPSLPEFWEG